MTSDTDDHPNKAGSLTVRGSSASVTTAGRGRRLISRMNKEALASIDSMRLELTPVMLRLGEYELHEEDYKQLHIWAEDYTERGDAITALQLANNLATSSNMQVSAWIERGRIKVADFSLLRLAALPHLAAEPAA